MNRFETLTAVASTIAVAVDTIWLAMGMSTGKASSKPIDGGDLLNRAPRRLQRDLETFLAHEDEWLPYRLWTVAGKKKLYERALNHGTPAEWADLLGLQLRSRSQRTAREREARVERELRRLLREHRFVAMPSLATLGDIGGSSLAVDVELSGGAARWAWRLSVPISSQGVARTKAGTERELRFYLRGRTTWPSRRQFEVMGQEKLLQAVYRGEGSEWWARRLGLEHPLSRPRRSRSPTNSEGTDAG